MCHCTEDNHDSRSITRLIWYLTFNTDRSRSRLSQNKAINDWYVKFFLEKDMNWSLSNWYELVFMFWPFCHHSSTSHSIKFRSILPFVSIVPTLIHSWCPIWYSTMQHRLCIASLHFTPKIFTMLLQQIVFEKMRIDSSMKKLVSRLNLGFVVGNERIRCHGQAHGPFLPLNGRHSRIWTFPCPGWRG